MKTMKTFKKNFIRLPLILIITILFQGCAVYHISPITLDQAVGSAYKVKVTTRDNKINIYHHIEKKDGAYFGIKYEHRDRVYPIKKEEVIIIELKDKRKSTVNAIYSSTGMIKKYPCNNGIIN